MWAAIAVAAWALAAPASAQPGTTESVTIAMASCGSARAEDIARLAHQVDLELRVAGIAVVDAVSAPDDATHVTIVPPGCLPGERAAMVVRAPGRAPLRRALEVAGDGADRVLALALVDAVRQAWASPREDRARSATSEELDAVRARVEREHASLREMERRFDALRRQRARESEERRREASARAALPAWDLFGGGALLGYEGSVGLLGAMVGGGVTLVGPLRLALEAMGGYGVVRDVLGEVGFAALRGVLGLELHVRAAPLTGFAGAWAATGWSRAEGRPEDPAMATSAVLDEATAALGLRAGGALELDASWSLFARVDAGYGFGGVAANAASVRRVAATRGALVSLAIGVRFHH